MDQIESKHIRLNSSSIFSVAQEFIGYEKYRYGFHHLGILKFLFLLLFMFHIPVAMIWLKIIPFEYRFYTFFCVLAVFIVYCFFRRYSLHELGFRMDNFSSSLHWNLLFFVIGSISLFMASKAGFLRPGNQTYLPHIYAFYILFLAPAQEVFFRGILFAEMNRIRIRDNKWTLLVSTLSFCFLHVIYNYPPLLIIAFISGLTWGIIFTKWPNIWGIALSHSLLGAMAMFLGVI